MIWVLYVSVEEIEEDMFGIYTATMYEQSINRQGTIKINEKDFENLVLSDGAKNHSRDRWSCKVT